MTEEQLLTEIDGWNKKIEEAVIAASALNAAIAKLKDAIDYYNKHKKIAQKQIELLNADTEQKEE